MILFCNIAFSDLLNMQRKTSANMILRCNISTFNDLLNTMRKSPINKI
uniref:Uncharacterized protein n=1 Tax=viral metagenome TaxID=1070528 RepID=A0A6C0CAP5_9ZZZZ